MKLINFCICYVGIAVTSALVILVIVAFLTFKFRYKAASILNKDYFKSKRSKGIDRNMEEFIKNYHSMLATKYSYINIQKMASKISWVKEVMAMSSREH